MGCCPKRSGTIVKFAATIGHVIGQPCHHQMKTNPASTETQYAGNRRKNRVMTKRRPVPSLGPRSVP